jgi:hypothetical protein
MNLELLEPHPNRVLADFRREHFDGLEILGKADKKAFFELCFREHLLERLAKSMLTARKKEQVPKQFVLAANLSLKLHGEHAFQAFDQVVRCGGLLNALDPAIASKHLDSHTAQVVLQCVGFNDKNSGFPLLGQPGRFSSGIPGTDPRGRPHERTLGLAHRTHLLRVNARRRLRWQLPVQIPQQHRLRQLGLRDPRQAQPPTLHQHDPHN